MLTSIVFAVAALVMLAYTLFGWNPYYSFKSGERSVTGIGTDLSKGVTVELENHAWITDSSFKYATHTSGHTSVSVSSEHPRKLPRSPQDTLVFLDTVSTAYEIHNWDNSSTSPYTASQLRIGSFSVNIKPQNAMQRIQLTIPLVIWPLVLAFVFWHLAKFLHHIQLGDSFNDENYKRLRNIGIAVLLFQLLLTVYGLFLSRYSISVTFASTIQNWRSPFYLSGTPSSGWSLTSIMVGLFFIIISKAFKTGNTLQQEQDLTI